MRIKERLILTLLLIGCLQSCIYDTNLLSEVDIKKPNTFQQLDITLSSANDSMVVFGQTDFNFNINTYNLKFNVAVLKYLNVEQTFSKSSGVFTLYPDITNENWFDLTIDFYICTGSGSIADKLNAENYVGSKTWKVKYVDLKTFNYQFQHCVNADSLLEVFWVKPKNAPVSLGRVTGSTNLTVTRISGDTVFYVDSTYCGNLQSYTLYIPISKYENLILNTTANYPYPELNITPIGFDSCLVSWTSSPIKRYYKLSDKYAGFKNSFKDLALPGTSTSYNLWTYPVNYTPSSSYSSYIWTTYVQGVKADYTWAYSNVKDKFVLSKSITNYPGLVWSDYTLPPYDRSVDGYGLEYLLVGNNAGTHFVGILDNVMHVFDENLTNTQQITLESKPEKSLYLYFVQLTDDGCFVSLNNYRELTLYNFGSDPSWQKFTFMPNFDDATTITIAMTITSLTADGHYAAVCGEKNLYIYDVSDHQHATVVFSTPRSNAFNVLANRLNKDELIVTSKDKIEVRSCPDFQLKKQLVLNGMGDFNIMNVDSYSNILLVSSSTYYHFIDLETMKEVFRFPLSGNQLYGYNGRLYRNQFFMGSTKTDMTSYLKKL